MERRERIHLGKGSPSWTTLSTRWRSFAELSEHQRRSRGAWGRLACGSGRTTSGQSSTSAAAGHERQPVRESRRLRPDRPGGRDSARPALAESRGLPPLPRLSFRMRAMTQPTEPLRRPRQGTWSQGQHAGPRTSARHRQAPTRLPARIGPQDSLLQMISDAIPHCGPVDSRRFPRKRPRRPSFEFRCPDCINGPRVLCRWRIEAGQQPSREVGTILGS